MRDEGHHAEHEELTPEVLIRAYVQGIFPMADPERGRIDWYRPEERGILPLATFHVPKNLRREMRKHRFEIRADTAFEDVMRACATDRHEENRSWINETLIRAYASLHGRGLAHSVEAWREGQLVGGLYGVSLGGAFFGESMFVRPDLGGQNASKICLVHLVQWLRHRGYILLDTQFWNPHLAQFGCMVISRRDYEMRLGRALLMPVTWGEFEPLAVDADGNSGLSTNSPLQSNVDPEPGI